nr:dihydrofolate reductase family protein [Rhodococcus wratislaviensis]GLK38989.1 hypothetical protein GCM10017611_58590 [Rhodococcus wratislaviensis]
MGIRTRPRGRACLRAGLRGNLASSHQDPDAVRQLKASAARNISIGGPGLASHAFAAGLVDACQVFVAPVVVGGGTRSLPERVRCRLELLDERRFGSGFAFLHYRVAS